MQDDIASKTKTMRFNKKAPSSCGRNNQAGPDHDECENDDVQRKKRREIFGGCALIEIIHLHDCLRGAIRALELDVMSLERQIKVETSKDESKDDGSAPGTSSMGGPNPDTTTNASSDCSAASLERRIAGRFKVIWSVFKSHSQAEDEYIWPALKTKTQNEQKFVSSGTSADALVVAAASDFLVAAPAAIEETTHSEAQLEQAEYEEDHADEEKMFREMDTLLADLRQMLRDDVTTAAKITHSIGLLSTKTHCLSQHLVKHLEKEETQCLPLVVKHLTNAEIHNLVGDIMGKRSADLIVQIMTMAVQNLDSDEREEMVKYMKESMAGTFFDRWLSMTGWSGSSHSDTTSGKSTAAPVAASVSTIEDPRKRPAKDTSLVIDSKRGRCDADAPGTTNAVTITSQAELEKLIRAIATNSVLTPEQRNTTIQGLRDSVWRSNQQQRRLSDETFKMSAASMPGNCLIDDKSLIAAHSTSGVRGSDPRRVTPPSKYFRKNDDGVIECISHVHMPLFTPSELAPTYHDGAAGAVLGCPHYARACKLRHPVSGKLFTCRLCCAQYRELQTKDQEEPLDRYAVTEVLCMICNALQPSSKGCINSDCESYGRPFAHYFCKICNLFDDSSRPAFHCPYCNACRRGHGLGQDYRHCMRCNACISLSEKEHQCIPQKLQGNCPICSESLFESTVQLRGLKCGHVMHLPCFAEYRRSQNYTCPLCKKSVEDMTDYFSLLDAAVRMQPMPIYHANTMSNIYCQDCEQQGQTKYHLVGLKCTTCNSYNTRELNRFQLDVASEQP